MLNILSNTHMYLLRRDAFFVIFNDLLVWVVRVSYCLDGC